jgi:uncharacterized protein YbjT (DUF2867 family)
MSPPPPPPETILLLGATGELGSSILYSLLSHTRGQNPPIAITAVLRRPSSATSTTSSSTLAHLSSLPITLLHIDITLLPPASLTTLFTRYTTIISCLGFSAGPGTQLRIARAALEARVPRFFPWQFGVDYDVIGEGSGQELFDEQRAVRALLRAQAEARGTGWVIVSTGVFMSFVVEPGFGLVEGLPPRTRSEQDIGKGTDVDGGEKVPGAATAAVVIAADAGPNADNARSPPPVITVRALGAWHHSLTTTCVEDIGRLTAAIILDPSINCEIVHLAGETFTYSQLADLIEKKFGQKGWEVKRELWTKEILKEALERSPGDTMRKYRAAFAEDRGVAWEREGTYHARRGMEVLGLEEWMERNGVV